MDERADGPPISSQPEHSVTGKDMRNKQPVKTMKAGEELAAEASFCDFAHPAAQVWSLTCVPHASGADNSHVLLSVLVLRAFVLFEQAHPLFLTL